MFRHSPRVATAELADIERRLQALERRIDRMGNGARSSAANAADRVGDVLANALGEVSDRFRGGAAAVGSEAARVGHEAARLGSAALHRVSAEVEHRPLVILAVAAGLGLLAGFAGRRH